MIRKVTDKPLQPVDCADLGMTNSANKPNWREGLKNIAAWWLIFASCLLK
jgi:hypothetical protein